MIILYIVGGNKPLVGCVSGSANTPNWDAVLFALIESTAIFFRYVLCSLNVHVPLNLGLFLRDMNLVIAAAQAAQEGDTQRAAELLKESQKAIDDVVSSYIQGSSYFFYYTDMI